MDFVAKSSTEGFRFCSKSNGIRIKPRKLITLSGHVHDTVAPYLRFLLLRLRYLSIEARLSEY